MEFKNVSIYTQEMKDRFYECIDYMKKYYRFQVIDCFDLIDNKSCFYDYEHLNEIGKREFTSYLNRKILAYKTSKKV